MASVPTDFGLAPGLGGASAAGGTVFTKTGSISASGDIIAAPGLGRRLAIIYLHLNMKGGANTVTLNAGSGGTTLHANRDFADDENHADGDPSGKQIHYLCDENTSFYGTLANSTEVAYYVMYRILDG